MSEMADYYLKIHECYVKKKKLLENTKYIPTHAGESWKISLS